jgi:predicted acylesterase/phospholipase RssA
MHSIRRSKMLAVGLICTAMTISLADLSFAAPRASTAACAKPYHAGLSANRNTRSAACAPRAKTSNKAHAKRIAARRSRTVQQAAQKPQVPPPRAEFTQQEQAAAVIPGIPEARFWADSEEEYRRVLGPLNGPWLALSAGGEDSAFGAGLLNGLSETGRRPDYAVVSGVSSGALLAPFAFLGPARDADLQRDFTAISAPDVFEDRRTVDSLMDTWPLREFIAKRITPQLLAEIATEHRRGRRLIIVTTNIDSGRPVAWNMGAIAAAGSEAALKLFRDILVATSAIPGLFPPVLIDVEANGRRLSEMHVDGGLAATVYIAPDSMLLASSSLRLPASQITLILNSKLVSEFTMTDRSLVGVLGRSLSIGVKRATRSAAILLAAAARRSGTDFNVAYVDQKFDHPSRGLFDPDYMKALFEAGRQQGRSDEPFRRAMPEATPPQAAAPQPAE